MNKLRIIVFARWVMVWVALAACWTRLPAVAGEAEEKFDVLQVGTRTYRNVTVTSKSKAYVFILHADGMTNLKWAELSPDLRKTLGYVESPTQKVETNGPSLWAKQALAKFDAPRVQALRAEVTGRVLDQLQAAGVRLPPMTPKLLAMLGGAVFLLYLFNCWCFSLICKKAGKEPGILIWLPILQVFPLLRAAGMSAWWFLGLLVPVLNLVACILWCFKIVDARGKNGLVTFLLVLPPTSLLAFLYLAFSDGTAPKKAEPRMQIMTLETA